MQTHDLEVVLKIAEFQSITGAADSLGLRVATASAALKRVEQQLGEPLFVRTTRRLRLSSAGERFLPECQQALELLSRAQQSLKGETGEVGGELRLSVSSDLGRNRVIPWLDALMDQHRDITLNVTISDRNVDFYRDSVDLALRYGSPVDSDVYGFKICTVPSILCASPDYLRQNNRLDHPEQLIDHEGLFYQVQGRPHQTWRFHGHSNGQAYKVRMCGRRQSNDGDLVRRWCVAGKGIALKSALDVAEDLLDGRLVQLLPSFQAESSELWLICPSRQSITPVVRLLRDQLRRQSSQLLDRLVENGVLTEEDIRR